MKKRDTYRYRLKDGRKTVYIGITNAPERRRGEHLDRRMKFDKMEIVGPRVTEDSARKWEEESIEKYRRNKGQTPRYNKELSKRKR